MPYHELCYAKLAAARGEINKNVISNDREYLVRNDIIEGEFYYTLTLCTAKTTSFGAIS